MNQQPQPPPYADVGVVTDGVEVLHAVTSLLVLPERCLVLLAVELGNIIVIAPLFKLEDVDGVDVVRHGVQLGRLALDVVGHLGGVDHDRRSSRLEWRGSRGYEVGLCHFRYNVH
jgi:hypothetical protein